MTGVIATDVVVVAELAVIVPEQPYQGEDATELALELADYCDLKGVSRALTRTRTGEIPFDTWTAAITELETCIRWQD